jgi:hypothetical protein
VWQSWWHRLSRANVNEVLAAGFKIQKAPVQYWFEAVALSDELLICLQEWHGAIESYRSESTRE